MNAVDDDDLFTPAEDHPKRARFGLSDDESRYRFPPPPGVLTPKPWIGWMRMTNLVSAFSDQERLQLWLERQTLLGLRTGDGLLFDEWMAEPVDTWSEDQFRTIAARYADRARQAAGADQGARRGTAQHQVMHTYLETGQVTGTRAQRLRLEAAMELLDAADLEPIPGQAEMRVWHPAAGGAMGTGDLRVLDQRTGQTGWLDWKTQQKFWTLQEVCGQLYGYDSAPWWWQGPPDATGGWVPAEEGTLRGHRDGQLPGRPVALVVHVPIKRDPGAPLAQLLEVDLGYGRAVLETAARNIELRSVGRSARVGRRPGGLRPVG